MAKKLSVSSIKNQLSWLGTVKRVHAFGGYQIAEYKDPQNKATYYHPYVEGQSTNHSFGSLEEAAVFAIAFKADGPNSARNIAEHFVKGIGLK